MTAIKWVACLAAFLTLAIVAYLVAGAIWAWRGITGQHSRELAA